MQPELQDKVEALAERAAHAWEAIEPPDDFADRVQLALDQETTPDGGKPPNKGPSGTANLSMLYRGPVLQAAVAFALIGAAVAIALMINPSEDEPAELRPSIEYVPPKPELDSDPETKKKPPRRAKPLPKNLPQKIEQYLQSFGRNYGDTFEFHGVVLVARDGEILFSRGFGFADRANHRAHSPDTLFPVGSLTQQFTATAILQLQEQGKLKLDDPVRMHVPELPESYDLVTIRHLLSHTAGVANFTDLPEWIEHRAQPHTTQELLAHFSDRPLAQPGVEFEPTNSSYALLGAVVEQVSKLPYGIYLQRHVLDPAGMRDSSYKDAQAPSRAAHGYTLLDDDTLGDAPAIDLSSYGAAAGLVASAEDLVRWDQALYGEKLLRPESIAQMYTADSAEGYGMGWAVENAYDQVTVSHPGGVEGFNASLVRMLEDRTLIIALANNDAVDCRDITTGVAQIVYGHRPNEPIEYEQGPAVPTPQLKQYAGLYTLSKSSRERLAKEIDPTFLEQLASVNIEHKGERLWMHIPVHGSHLMYPQKDKEHGFFFKDGPGTQAEFHQPATDGAPAWLNLKQGQTEFLLKKVDFR